MDSCHTLFARGVSSIKRFPNPCEFQPVINCEKIGKRPIRSSLPVMLSEAQRSRSISISSRCAETGDPSTSLGMTSDNTACVFFTTSELHRVVFARKET